ncbi:MAG: GNAT family N-acetyltransferase [Theionarchaea archaeon]|nr:GNAT family N-acetyltransferase [Theionarchaea archaeon]
MTYTIRSYQEEVIEGQERVGREVTKNWKSFEQSSADRLRQAYLAPDFDPETRLYCFEDGTLVGFLTSSVIREGEKPKKANLEFPLVLSGHEEAESLLLEKAFDILRKKGVEAVRTRVSKAWGKTFDMAKRWGYTFVEDQGVAYTADLAGVVIPESPGLYIVVAYDHEKDYEHMVDIFVREYGMTPEQARANFDALENAGDLVISHVVIRKNGQVTGRALALRYENNLSHGHTGALFVTDERQRPLLLSRLVKDCKAKGVETLDATIFGEMLKNKNAISSVYESLGFVHLATVSYYEKKI